MTREEEIKLYLKERNIPIDSLEANSIIEGIEWAYSHPNLSEEEQVGMGELGNDVAKEALIEKVCKWLKQSEDDYYKYDTWKGDWYVDFDALIEGLKKAMEE